MTFSTLTEHTCTDLASLWNPCPNIRRRTFRHSIQRSQVNRSAWSWSATSIALWGPARSVWRPWRIPWLSEHQWCHVYSKYWAVTCDTETINTAHAIHSASYYKCFRCSSHSTSIDRLPLPRTKRSLAYRCFHQITFSAWCSPTTEQIPKPLCITSWKINRVRTAPCCYRCGDVIRRGGNTTLNMAQKLSECTWNSGRYKFTDFVRMTQLTWYA